MRRIIAFSALQLACWVGRWGFRLQGRDMRESLVALQIVPTRERAERELQACERELQEWLRKVADGEALNQVAGGSLHETPKWKGWARS